jgi:TatA/E family protein of Tat protein translocase
MPFGIGASELAILLLVALVVFGPSKLPELGKQLGKGMRELRDALGGVNPDGAGARRSRPDDDEVGAPALPDRAGSPREV